MKEQHLDNLREEIAAEKANNTPDVLMEYWEGGLEAFFDVFEEDPEHKNTIRIMRASLADNYLENADGSLTEEAIELHEDRVSSSRGDI